MRNKPDYWYNQSAVVPFRETGDDDLQVLLISSRKKKRWVIPKGIREPDMSPAASAAKEALEEAGITGVLSRNPIGGYRYGKWGGTCSVEVYAMRVDKEMDHWLEDFRDRCWVPVEEAAQRVAEPELKRIIQALPRLLLGGDRLSGF